MDRDDVTDADDAPLAAGELAEAAHELGIGRLADQQPLGFIGQHCCGNAEDHANDDRRRTVIEGIAGELGDKQPDRRRNDPGHRRAILKQHDERRRVLRTADGLNPAEIAFGLPELLERLDRRPAFEQEGHEQHAVGDERRHRLFGMRNVEDAFIDRDAGAERKHQHRNHEAPEI